MKTTKLQIQQFSTIVDRYDSEIGELYLEIDIIDNILSDNLIAQSKLIHELQNVRAELEIKSNMLVSKVCALRKIESALASVESTTKTKTNQSVKTKKPVKTTSNEEIVKKGVENLKKILHIE